MRYWKDLNTEEILSETALESEFKELKAKYPDEYEETTFEQWLNNCQWYNNGTLEYTKRR